MINVYTLLTNMNSSECPSKNMKKSKENEKIQVNVISKENEKIQVKVISKESTKTEFRYLRSIIVKMDY